MRICPACGNRYPDDANFCPMDATRLPDPPSAAAAAGEPASLALQQTMLGVSADRTVADLRPVIAGRFQVVGPRIGVPTGLVSAAVEVATQQPVQLLVVDPRALPTPTLADRALRELKQLAKAKSDRILRVIDQGRTAEGEVYIASEPPGAPSLDELVAGSGPLSPERARAVLLDVGDALLEAQKVGVIHRDLAPRNIYLGDRARLTGFGVAEPIDDRIFGAPGFLSPEQAEGKPVDQRSNIYSLGALLYYLLVGEPPFAGDPKAQIQQHLHAQPAPPSQRRPGLAPEFDRVVQKALEKSGGRRHLTLRQLLNEVDAALAPAAAAAAGPTARTPLVAAARPAPPLAVDEPIPLAAAALPPPSTSLRPDDVGTARTIMGMEAAMRSAGVPAPGQGPGRDPATGGHVDDPRLAGRGDENHEAVAHTLVGAARPAQVALPSNRASADPGAATIVNIQAPPEVSRAVAERATGQTAVPVLRPPAVAPLAQPVPHAAPVPSAAVSDARLVPVEPAPERPQPLEAASSSLAETVQSAAERAAATTFGAPAMPLAPAAPPVAASPSLAPASVGRKKPFRETAWFKKGELEEELARQAAEANADDPLAGPAQFEAFVEDSSLTAEDRARLSLKTGRTEMMQAVRPSQLPGDKMTEEDMLAEMEAGSRRTLVIAGLAIGVSALLAAVYFLFLR